MISKAKQMELRQAIELEVHSAAAVDLTSIFECLEVFLTGPHEELVSFLSQVSEQPTELATKLLAIYNNTQHRRKTPPTNEKLNALFQPKYKQKANKSSQQKLLSNDLINCTVCGRIEYNAARTCNYCQLPLCYYEVNVANQQQRKPPLKDIINRLEQVNVDADTGESMKSNQELDGIEGNVKNLSKAALIQENPDLVGEASTLFRQVKDLVRKNGDLKKKSLIRPNKAQLKRTLVVQ